MSDSINFELDRDRFNASNHEVMKFGRSLRQFIDIRKIYCLVPLARSSERIATGLSYMLVNSKGVDDNYAIVRPADVEVGSFRGLRSADLNGRFVICIDEPYDQRRAAVIERSLAGLINFENSERFAGGLYIGLDTGDIKIYEFDKTRVYRRANHTRV